jgi:hypothetical protein
MSVHGFAIEYLALTSSEPGASCWPRFGDFAAIRYQRASNHTFRSFPSSAQFSNKHQLHEFYALPRKRARALKAVRRLRPNPS